MVRALSTRRRNEVENWVVMTAGSLAGLAYTLVSYPIDSVKSNIQAGLDLKSSLRNGLDVTKMKGYRIVVPQNTIGAALNLVTY